MNKVYEITFKDGKVYLQRAMSYSQACVEAAHYRVYRDGSARHTELTVASGKRLIDLDEDHDIPTTIERYKLCDGA